MRLQQGFMISGMGSDPWQQSSGPNVRFRSKADVGAGPDHVRFTPKSEHLGERALCQKTVGA
jgi:hypothetical protein